jgi:hypothetical protein
MQKKMTKNKALLLLGMMASFNLYGQSCQGIPDGTTSRLDSAGGPLENFRTQDQDGLGTCYANTASVMLQSRLPGNPNVSYLNLAFMFAEKYEAPKVRQHGTDSGRREDDKPGNEEPFLVDGGFSCDAINSAKDRGGVCNREDVALEHMFHSGSSLIGSDSSWIQKDLVGKLTKYYDGVFKDFGRQEKKEKKKNFFGTIAPEPNTSKFEDYKNALKDVLKNNKDKFTSEQCLKPEIKNSEKVVENLLARIYQFTQNPKNNKNKNFKAIEDAGRKLGRSFKMTVNGVYKLDTSVYEATKNMLKTTYMEGLSKASSTNGDATNVLIKSIQSMAPAFNEKMFADLGGWSEEDRDLLAKDTDRYINKNVEECINASKLAYFTSDDGLMKDFASNTCLAQYTNHAKNIKELVTTLDKANMKNIDSLYSFLMDLPEMNYEQAMMKMVGPDCPDNKKIKIPDNFECVSGSFYYSDDKTPSNDEKYLNETRSKLKNLAKDAMTQGNAIGLSMCTGFFGKETPDAFYSKTRECPTTKHGFHAVTMVGYRCMSGKIQYLIQNSWGDWSAAKERFPDTEPGKAWISEDDLARNVYRYDMIK